MKCFKPINFVWLNCKCVSEEKHSDTLWMQVSVTVSPSPSFSLCEGGCGCNGHGCGCGCTSERGKNPPAPERTELDQESTGRV